MGALRRPNDTREELLISLAQVFVPLLLGALFGSAELYTGFCSIAPQSPIFADNLINRRFDKRCSDRFALTVAFPEVWNKFCVAGWQISHENKNCAMSDISHIVATPYSSPLQTAELGIAGRNNDGQELTWPEGAARLEGHGPNITVPHQGACMASGAVGGR